MVAVTPQQHDSLLIIQLFYNILDSFPSAVYHDSYTLLSVQALIPRFPFHYLLPNTVVQEAGSTMFRSVWSSVLLGVSMITVILYYYYFVYNKLLWAS